MDKLARHLDQTGQELSDDELLREDFDQEDRELVVEIVIDAEEDETLPPDQPEPTAESLEETVFPASPLEEKPQVSYESKAEFDAQGELVLPWVDPATKEQRQLRFSELFEGTDLPDLDGFYHDLEACGQAVLRTEGDHTETHFIYHLTTVEIGANGEILFAFAMEEVPREDAEPAVVEEDETPIASERAPDEVVAELEVPNDQLLAGHEVDEPVVEIGVAQEAEPTNRHQTIDSDPAEDVELAPGDSVPTAPARPPEPAEARLDAIVIIEPRAVIRESTEAVQQLPAPTQISDSPELPIPEQILSGLGEPVAEMPLPEPAPAREYLKAEAGSAREPSPTILFVANRPTVQNIREVRFLPAPARPLEEPATDSLSDAKIVVPAVLRPAEAVKPDMPAPSIDQPANRREANIRESGALAVKQQELVQSPSLSVAARQERLIESAAAIPRSSIPPRRPSLLPSSPAPDGGQTAVRSERTQSLAELSPDQPADQVAEQHTAQIEQPASVRQEAITGTSSQERSELASAPAVESGLRQVEERSEVQVPAESAEITSDKITAAIDTTTEHAVQERAQVVAAWLRDFTVGDFVALPPEIVSETRPSAEQLTSGDRSIQFQIISDSDDEIGQTSRPLMRRRHTQQSQAAA